MQQETLIEILTSLVDSHEKISALPHNKILKLKGLKDLPGHDAL